MRRAGLVFGFFILMSVLLTLPVYADERTENLVSRILDDFDNPDQNKWVIRGSKFVTEGFPKSASPTSWPSALYGSNSEGNDYKVLGVNAKFDRKGYNYIELIPDVRNEKGEFTGIPIPGRCKMIDLWAWGSNYDYYAEAHITDYRGITHVLPLGNLNYEGWRNLKVRIPNYIPQGRSYIPKMKQLSLAKIVVWTRPSEKVDNYYIYFDQIKVLTDIFISRFDGDELAETKKVEEIWSTAGGN
jgi:hypothetical protein